MLLLLNIIQNVFIYLLIFAKRILPIRFRIIICDYSVSLFSLRSLKTDAKAKIYTNVTNNVRTAPRRISEVERKSLYLISRPCPTYTITAESKHQTTKKNYEKMFRGIYGRILESPILKIAAKDAQTQVYLPDIECSINPGLILQRRTRSF